MPGASYLELTHVNNDYLNQFQNHTNYHCHNEENLIDSETSGHVNICPDLMNLVQNELVYIPQTPMKTSSSTTSYLPTVVAPVSSTSNQPVMNDKNSNVSKLFKSKSLTI